MERTQKHICATQKVIDHLKKEVRDEQFNMQVWINPHGRCGTTCCIGGWGHYVAHGNFNTNEVNWRELASEVFGVPFGENLPALFSPAVSGQKLGRKPTREDAIKVLENLQLTGEVDWKVARE